MSNSESRSVTVANQNGLHMRPAFLFAEAAAQFQCEIEIAKGDLKVDGKSVLSLMSLGAKHGTRLELNAHGPDAVEAIQQLSRLMESGFPEAPTPEETDKV